MAHPQGPGQGRAEAFGQSFRDRFDGGEINSLLTQLMRQRPAKARGKEKLHGPHIEQPRNILTQEFARQAECPSVHLRFMHGHSKCILVS